MRPEIHGVIYIKHTRRHIAIVTDAKQWFDKNGSGLYYKDLQTARVSPAGWMLWSFCAMDTQTISAAWERELGIKVSFCFAFITVNCTPVHESQQIRDSQAWAASAQIDNIK